MLIMRRIIHIAILFFLLCISGIAQAFPPRITVQSVREIGPLQFIAVVKGRDGGFSAKFRDKSVWVFGDTLLGISGESARNLRSSTWCWTNDFNAEDGISGLEEPTDNNGEPFEFIPFTEDEIVYNKAGNRDDIPIGGRSRWALWPGPVVINPDSGKAFVFYQKIFAKPGPFNFKSVGSAIATWDSPGQTLIRHTVNLQADYPTILFPENDIQMGKCALAHGKWLYAFGSTNENAVWSCVVGRVLFSDALNRDAWEFYKGNGKWTKIWKQVTPVIDAGPMFTVQWNEYLDKYLAIYSMPMENTICIRTADAIEGPWSDPIVIFKTLPPPDSSSWCYSGLGHQELNREKGRIVYFTYFRPADPSNGEIRLVEAIFK